MLKKFSVENFKIFENEITIDFSKVRDYKFNHECISNNIINKSILYGKNSVGKTNLGYALMDVRNMVLPNELISDNTVGFLNANAKKNYATFTYAFQIGEDEIIYTYEKYEPTTIKYEQFIINKETLYKYDFDLKKGDFENLQTYDEVKHLNFDEWDNETSIIRYILSNAKLKEYEAQNT